MRLALVIGTGNQWGQPYGLESTLREMTDRDRQMLLAGPVARIAGDDEIP